MEFVVRTSIIFLRAFDGSKHILEIRRVNTNEEWPIKWFAINDGAETEISHPTEKNLAKISAQIDRLELWPQSDDPHSTHNAAIVEFPFVRGTVSLYGAGSGYWEIRLAEAGIRTYLEHKPDTFTISAMFARRSASTDKFRELWCK